MEERSTGDSSCSVCIYTYIHLYVCFFLLSVPLSLPQYHDHSKCWHHQSSHKTSKNSLRFVCVFFLKPWHLWCLFQSPCCSHCLQAWVNCQTKSGKSQCLGDGRTWWDGEDLLKSLLRVMLHPSDEISVLRSQALQYTSSSHPSTSK